MPGGTLRYWQIDALRGTAIALMVVFHFFYDADYLGIMQNAMYQGAWLIVQRVTISLFLFITGYSLWLSYEKLRDKSPEKIFEKYAKRAAQIFAAALAVSIATFFAVPQSFVVFGVLHFIALSTLLGLLFLRFTYLNLFLGLAVIIISIFYSLPAVETPVLLWLGFTYPGFQSVDFVPLFPWFGLVLIGIFAAKRVELQHSDSPGQLALLVAAGKNSLWIYLLHQPVIFALLYAFVFLSGYFNNA
ncbi:DUF1624 domain-containing protein [Candidatus Micrarchaeota archaeon]|nr:DUF1624 domain-containing protein [Candidatus Micrarchaeota archaeon]